ncbi:MAG: PAS domain-containing protein [Gallionellaceae bacterium]|jgi:PAS domain S-box-containing protein
MQIYIFALVLLCGLALYLWLSKQALAKRLNQLKGGRYGQRFKEVFENSSDAIFVIEVSWDAKLLFESLNPAALRIFDMEETYLKNKTIDAIIAAQAADTELPRILQELSGNLVRAITTGLPVRYESTFRFVAETVPETYDINLVPMVDDSGISHILCFAQDVSARKLYEQELLERVRLEEKLSGFAASAPGFFYTYRHGVNGSNAMPFASAGIGELFGLQPQDVAQDISPMSMLIHPDDLSIFIQAVAISAAYMAPLLIEFRVRHPHKGELWIESRALPRAERDGSVIWHGFMHEVSGRKRVEDALRTSHEHLAEAQRIGQMGSWELNLESGTLTWSDEIFRIFEINEALFGASYEAFLNAIHPDDRDAVNNAYTESVANRIPYCIDHRLLFADGRIKHVRECGETHYDANGKALHSHGTVQDVTALKETERKLTETQKKLRELAVNRESEVEQTRRRIAWEMHEELGQLLAAAKMRIYGMRRKFPKDISSLGEDGNVLVGLLDKSIRCVRDLVSDLRPTALLLGIAPALEWLVAEFNKHTSMVCDLEMGEEGEPASDELITQVFRVAQEALESIARCAGVSRVHISWQSKAGSHVLTLRHDGHANASDLVEGQSLSFFGIQERVNAFGGEMRVFSELEHHSSIEVRFPVR